MVISIDDEYYGKRTRPRADGGEPQPLFALAVGDFLHRQRQEQMLFG